MGHSRFGKRLLLVSLTLIPFRFSVISSVLAVIFYFHERFFLLLLLDFCTLRYYLVLSVLLQVQLETS
jgi:hypothetical protein